MKAFILACMGASMAAATPYAVETGEQGREFAMGIGENGTSGQWVVWSKPHEITMFPPSSVT